MKRNRLYSYNLQGQITADFYGSDLSQYCYIPILKNAHSFGVDFFAQVSGFQKTEDFADKKYIIFLRDPIKRWVSGVGQWFYQNYPGIDDFTIDPLMLKLLFSAVRIDGHTKRQTEFLTGVKMSNGCIFFNIDDPEFENKLHQFAKFTIRGRFPKYINVPKKQVTIENPLKIKIRDQLLTAMEENLTFKESVLDYYDQDIRMFTRTTFYEP